jgi:cytochrome c oxidase subunit 2
MTFWRKTAGLAALFTVSLFAMSAEAGTGVPSPWQMNFQGAASPVMERITDFHNMLLWIITVISLFVLALMLYVFIRFNAKTNPTPSKTTHNSLLEVLWTVIPILILVGIAVPSFKLLYYSDRAPDAEMTIKAVGHQWYWSYEYPDHGDFTFDAIMLEDGELAEGQPRLLATDTTVVVPVNTKVRLLVTADDVIHSWAIPSFGVKLDGVPGRVNETWFEVNKEGMYYGQCSELCGTRHGFMPIQVKAVSKDEFAKWVEFAKQEYAQVDGATSIKLAAKAAR